MARGTPARGVSEIRVQTLTGDALKQNLPALARLRATVFRDWPYLYEAEPGYEEGYIREYANSAGAALVLALDDQEPVGASTCLPMVDETDAVQAPFRDHGLDPRRFFYFGESVLLPAYRGRGIGVAFFREREAHALRASDADYCCFCAVQRPDDHPLRPPDAGSLAPFWRARGYTAYPQFACTFEWRDVGQTEKTPKTLTFWLKSLRGAALP